ncbi:unnamed protein product [Pleuronectes platessa]|uniref:Uncharacterized protein n=1 Tax=Pleuronectes platessa TaxID=8262 RepID=A0A9N7TV63_PLEPL|nr:unnamed protein product [Pleuronectes platessa]
MWRTLRMIVRSGTAECSRQRVLLVHGKGSPVTSQELRGNRITCGACELTGRSTAGGETQSRRCAFNPPPSRQMEQGSSRGLFGGGGAQLPWAQFNPPLNSLSSDSTQLHKA